MYIIQEIQTTNNVSSLLPAITKTDRHEAESVFHTILASAAISQVTVHTAILYDEHGSVLRQEFYEHIPEVEPNPET